MNMCAALAHCMYMRPRFLFGLCLLSHAHCSLLCPHASLPVFGMTARAFHSCIVPSSATTTSQLQHTLDTGQPPAHKRAHTQTTVPPHAFAPSPSSFLVSGRSLHFVHSSASGTSQPASGGKAGSCHGAFKLRRQRGCSCMHACSLTVHLCTAVSFAVSSLDPPRRVASPKCARPSPSWCRPWSLLLLLRRRRRLLLVSQAARAARRRR